MDIFGLFYTFDLDNYCIFSFFYIISYIWYSWGIICNNQEKTSAFARTVMDTTTAMERGW